MSPSAWATSPLPDEVAAALYLACACVAGDATAARTFDDHYMPGIRRAIARVRLTQADADDVAQSLRQLLLVGGKDGSPRIGEYGGRGDLTGWLRVTAARAAAAVCAGAEAVVEPRGYGAGAANRPRTTRSSRT